MAIIENVDYLSMPSKVEKIREYGRDLNDEITEIYGRVTEMHEYWHGERYNDLVKSFNKIIPNFNNILELIVSKIPFALDAIANNYSNIDRGIPVTDAKEEAQKKILEIPMFEDTTMRFITAKVIEERQKIQENFIKSKEIMNDIETTYRLIEWKSEASEIFEEIFVKLKNSISTSIDDLNTEFAKLMEKTQQDMAKTENANTLK